MQPTGYSPFRHRRGEKKPFKLPFSLPKFSGGMKKWIYILLGIILGLFLIFYICLGDLRFFANHYLGLTFFNKNYLIVLQNNYELRPGGGFVTAYGKMDTLLGFPTHLSFHNSYEIDTETYITPPYPHEDLLKNEWYEGYTFRDANWDPHFPNAAEELKTFYQLKFPSNDVDGVVVVNFSFIEDLIGELGEIEVNEKILTKKNLFGELEFEVNDIDRHSEEALEGRKSILSDLAGNLITKAKWHPFKTRDAVVNALHNKDIYMWMDNSIERSLIKKGWANNLETEDGMDFLAVNIANLGAKKADRYIQKEVHYFANLTKEIPEITTEVTIRYPGYKNTYSDDYKGYLRVLVPKGADIDADLIDATVTEEDNYKVLGTKIIVPAGSKSTITYTYTLPRTFLNGTDYKLRVIKQSGDNKHYFLNFETASDHALESETLVTLENRASWSGMLTNDEDFLLEILPDETAPYPIEQVFEALNTISIYWSEPIDKTSGSDLNNFSIFDKNTVYPNVTDEVKVGLAEVVGENIIKLELEGVTNQPLERYQIEMVGIKDTSGNVINPIPKIITAVQRIQEKTEESAIPTSSPFSLN